MSTHSRQNSALASLTATYTDSDISDDDSRLTPMRKPTRYSPSDDNSSQSTTGGNKGPVSRLVSYMNDEDVEKEDDEHRAAKNEITTNVGQLKQMKELLIDEDSRDSVKDYTFSLRRASMDDIELPSEPSVKCSPHLQEKIAKHFEKKSRDGLDLNDSIQKRKDFRNPSIYEKLISFCLIDELGTNYPSDIYDPHSWKDDSFYEELAKAQKVEMDKRQKERTKVEFVSGTKKSATTPAQTAESAADDSKKRKSKWDVGAMQPALPVLKTFISHPPGIVPVTTTASGTKATVISAFGTITKKAKQ